MRFDHQSINLLSQPILKLAIVEEVYDTHYLGNADFPIFDAKVI